MQSLYQWEELKALKSATNALLRQKFSRYGKENNESSDEEEQPMESASFSANQSSSFDFSSLQTSAASSAISTDFTDPVNFAAILAASANQILSASVASHPTNDQTALASEPDELPFSSPTSFATQKGSENEQQNIFPTFSECEESVEKEPINS